ncbi:hypothetical protein CapIbe_011440 [Capra ibex]
MDRAAGVMSRDPSDPLKMPNGNTSSVLQHTRMVWPHPLCTGIKGGPPRVLLLLLLSHFSRVRLCATP